MRLSGRVWPLYRGMSTMVYQFGPKGCTRYYYSVRLTWESWSLGAGE